MALSQLELTQKPFIELQIEALINENQIRSKRARKFIDDLQAGLGEIKNLNYEKLFRRKFRLPLLGRPNNLEDDDYPKALKFRPPTHVQVIGGYANKTALKRTNFIDLAVVMPAACFERKDVKNQRYHHKKALYLAMLARLLSGPVGFKLVEKVEFCFHQGDYLKPVLILNPRSPKLKKLNVMFQIFTVPEADFDIKASLLTPDRGNIAPKWFFEHVPPTERSDEINEFIDCDSTASATPYYNSSLLSDIEATANSDIIKEHVKPKTSVAEALILTKIWLYQRELHRHFSFVMSMFVTYLLTKQKIHQNMSSFQIFKLIIKNLHEQDWSNPGLSFFEDSADKLPAFRKVHPVVFLSPSGNLNLCYNVTKDIYHRLKHEAQLALEISNSGSTETFDKLFLKKLDFINKFDVVVHIPKLNKRLPQQVVFLKRYMDYGVVSHRLFSDSILDLAHKSLTDRITLLQQNPNDLCGKWGLKGIPFNPTNGIHQLTLGILLDAEKSLRIIDIGPDAQSSQAEEFRAFWDPKSQLRLQNGVISETVVWHVDSFSQRRAIIKYILTHALRRLGVNRMTVNYTLLERFIDLKNVHFTWRDDIPNEQNRNGKAPLKRPHDDDNDDGENPDGKPIGVGEEVYHKVLHSYNEINKVLRSVQDMKHSITSIQPTSHHLRAGGVFPPLPVSLQQRNKSLKRRKGVTLFPSDFAGIGRVLFIEPVEILITLDSGGKWPSDLEALNAEKLDYLVQLGAALKTREYCIKFSEDYMDILHGQFVFRIRVRCQKEMSMISAAKGKQELHKKRYECEILPRVHGALDQLYRQRPAFSLTCRLVKRWLSCHLMTNHINDVTLDLMVAHLFLDPQPYTEPASSACGFKRFLELVAGHNWSDSPLIVNFDNQLKIDEVSRLRKSIQEERAKYPPLVICTPFDRERPSPWTRDEPSENNLELLVKICSKAKKYFIDSILRKSPSVEECRALFRPNFRLFDLIVKLDPRVVQTFFMSIDPPKSYNVVGKEPGAKQASPFKVMPIVGMNIVEQFVTTLAQRFGHVAEFYFDRYGQRVIGVIMKPESEKLLDGDMDKFIANIKTVGAKLVESVSLRRDQ